MDLDLSRFYYSSEKPIHEVTYEIMRDIIVCGYVFEGEQIIESHYAKTLNVSRTPIRVAIEKLETQGLVYEVKGKTYAKGLGVSGINNIYDLQISLERLVLNNVLNNISQKDVIDFYQIFDQINEAAENGNLIIASELNEMIHQKIFQISAYPGIVDIIKIAYDYVRGFNLLAFKDLSRQSKITFEHRLMVENICNKDYHNTYLSLKEHIDCCKKYSIEKYNQNIERRKEELELI